MPGLSPTDWLQSALKPLFKGGDKDQCGEKCTDMQAMPVGKLSKREQIKESYQKMYGKKNIIVDN